MHNLVLFSMISVLKRMICELAKDLKYLAETLFLFYVYHNKTSVSRPEYDICAQECKICGFSGSSFVAL